MALSVRWPIADVLARVERFVPLALVEEPALRRVMEFGEQLPDGVSRFYLETRLGPGGSPCVDFACGLPANDGRPSAKRWAGKLLELVESQPGWAALRPYLRHWLIPMPESKQDWPCIWFGFDDVASAPCDRVPVPCVSLELSEGLGRSPDSSTTKRVGAELERLLGGSLPKGICGQLGAYVGALPVGGRLMYASCMLGRPTRDLKLNILVPSDAVVGYLLEAGWLGGVEEIEDIIGRHFPPRSLLRLDLTMGQLGEGRIGLERLSRGQRPNAEDARAIANGLVSAGLCSPAKREALRSWWGDAVERHPSHNYDSRMARSWYAKLCRSAERPLYAKAYLGFFPLPLAGFALSNHESLSH